MQEKCILDPERDCLGLRRAEELAGDLKALDTKLNGFQQNITDTNSRFGARIGKLEAREEVREEQYKHVREKLDNITRDMSDFQKENKDSVSELRKEHKESMEELRKGNKDILDAVTPLKHKVEQLEQLSDDVEELKEKPAKRWDGIIEKIIGIVVAAVVGFILAKVGLQ